MSASGSSPRRPDLAWSPAPGIVVALVLTGCAAPQSALLPDIETWEARQTVLADLDEWAFSGRIAV